MENENLDDIAIEYFSEDWKREDTQILIAYINILNKLLEIVVSVIGIERCKKILGSLISEHEILQGSQITETGKFIHPKAITILREHGEQVGSSIVLGGFNRLISEILEAYSSLSSFQLGTTALISAASRALKEVVFREAVLTVEKKKAEEFAALNQQLKANEQQLKASNQQLRANEQQLKAANQQLKANEQQLQAANQQLKANEQTLLKTQEELKQKLADLELFKEITVGRESKMIELKKEVNQLLKESEREPKYDEIE